MRIVHNWERGLVTFRVFKSVHVPRHFEVKRRIHLHPSLQTKSQENIHVSTCFGRMTLSIAILCREDYVGGKE